MKIVPYASRSLGAVPPRADRAGGSISTARAADRRHSTDWPGPVCFNFVRSMPRGVSWQLDPKFRTNPSGRRHGAFVPTRDEPGRILSLKRPLAMLPNRLPAQVLHCLGGGRSDE